MPFVKGNNIIVELVRYPIPGWFNPLEDTVDEFEEYVEEIGVVDLSKRLQRDFGEVHKLIICTVARVVTDDLCVGGVVDIDFTAKSILAAIAVGYNLRNMELDKEAQNDR
jgi:hypothetical protein